MLLNVPGNVAGQMAKAARKWPGFEMESRYFDLLASKGWLLRDKDGNPVDGLAERSDRAGALIDSTNPKEREWYWGRIRDNIAARGFDWFWLDETEPDLWRRCRLLQSTYNPVSRERRI